MCRAQCLANWVLDQGLRSASSHPYVRRLCAHQRQPEVQLPTPWVRALSYMVQSMVSIVCSFWLGDSNEVSSTQWGMRAPPLYYRSCISDGAWLFVAARAPHHKIRIGPVVPKKRKCLGLLVVGLGAVLCGPKFPGRLHSSPKTSLHGVKPVVVWTVVL